MKLLAFHFKFVEWDALQEMTFTSIELCLRKAVEWSEDAGERAQKAARRKRE